MTRLNEVASDVFRLGNDVFNFYLLRAQGKFTLIDAGFPGFWKQLTETLAALGGVMTDIEGILITHAHLDHVGLARKVSLASGARIFAHVGDRKRIAKGGAQLPPPGLLMNAWRRHPFRMLSTAIWNNVFFGPGIRNFVPLQDEQVLDLPGSPTTLFVPGHTHGSTAFWVPGRRVLFAGDALVTVDIVKGGREGPQLTSPHTEDDRIQAISSLQRFCALGEATLLTGHGDPWVGDMREAVSLATQRAALEV